MPFFHFLVFLLCPGCEKLLTASQSKDNTKSYPHYHCTVRCSCRFMVELFNGVFVDELKKYVPRPEVAKVYRITLKEAGYQLNRVFEK